MFICYQEDQKHETKFDENGQNYDMDQEYTKTKHIRNNKLRSHHMSYKEIMTEWDKPCTESTETNECK